MHRLWLDFLFALRSLRRHPGFSVVAALTLALGIGSTTAIFSVVNDVVLRPLPYPDSEKLIRVWSANRQSGVDRGDMSGADLLDFGEMTRTLDGIAGFYPYDATWLDDEGNAIKLMGAGVTHNFFDVLGINPVLGRTFVSEEGQPGAELVLVLGHSAWQTLFNGRTDILGQSVTLEGGPLTVVGVAPPGFDYPDGAQGWISIPQQAGQARRARFWKAVARVRPTSLVEAAQADLESVARQLEQDYPGTNNEMGVSMVSLRASILGNLQAALLILIGAAGVLLLISCVNVANLLLARGASRTREIALRAALGAGRARIAAQLLTESVVLALTGAVIGIAGAWVGVRSLGVLGPPALTRYDSLGVDGTVLLYALGVSVVTGILFGFAPALRLGMLDLRAALAEGGRGAGGGKGSGHLRDLLVIAVLTLALVFVVGAGLLVRSFSRLQTVDLGFRSENILAFELALPVSQYDDFGQIGDFYTNLLQRLEADPQVLSTAAASTLPLGPQIDFLMPVTLDGRPAPLPGEEPQAYLRQVSAGFFGTMGIEMVEGREFDSNDRQDSPGVAIISEGFAARHYADENPIGQSISGIPGQFGPLGRSFHNELEIVGVAKDVRFGSVAEASPLSIFMVAAQAPFRRMTVLLETRADPLSLISVVRREVTAMDSGLALGRVDSLERIVAASLAGERFSMLLLGLFAVVALALASVGIYGVISYGVKERTTEIAVRQALGAEPSNILNLILLQGGRLVAIAIPVGLFIAWASGQVVANQLYEVSARDPVVFGAVTGVIAAVAVLATLIPAVRAMGVSPSEVLQPD